MSRKQIISGAPFPRIPATNDPELGKFHQDLLEYVRRLSSAQADIMINMLIEAPVTQVYTVVEYAIEELSLVSITHKLLSGTITTLNVRVAGVALTGSGDNSPSSTQGVYTFDKNTVKVGDRIDIDVTIGSSPVDLAFTIKGTLT
jgi:hypothetical protein